MKKLSPVYFVWVVLSALIALLPFSAFGAGISVNIGKVFLMEEVLIDPASTHAHGFSRTLAIADRHLLMIPMEYEVVWDEQTKKLKFTRDQIRLLDDSGKFQALLGEMKYYSGLRTYFSGISESRPKNWEKKKTSRKKKRYPVFVVEKPGAAYELKIGDNTYPVTAPKTVTDLGPNAIADFKVTKVDWTGKVEGKQKIGKTEYEVVNTPVTGRFLAVTVKIDPRPPIPMEDNAFFWHTSWFGLKSGEGNYVTIAGEQSTKNLDRSISHNHIKGKSGWKVAPKTLYFALPAKSGTFDLYCLGRPVAKVAAPDPK